MPVLSGAIKISVYSGLTLSEVDVKRILPAAILRPPVKQFDLLADIHEGCHVVVIVDGVFHQNPAVSPCEIMDALRRGLLVYGCSSMGALRAAELYPYGMRGVGKIYEWVRCEPAFRDDFPGQIFSTEGGVIKPLSFTHVDFVFNLKRLVERGRLNREQQAFLEKTSRDTYYPERTVAGLVHQLKRCRPNLIPVATYALTKMQSQKRIDALSALKKVKADLLAVAKLNDNLMNRSRARDRRMAPAGRASTAKRQATNGRAS